MIINKINDFNNIVMARLFLHGTAGSIGDISNYSHKEKGYMETRKGEIISHAYATDIELS